MMNFHDKKKKQLMSRIIVALIILAMVGTLFAGMAASLAR